MKILLVYPSFPDTFWSLKHALKFISKKASFPPLGLLTVSAMLPENWLKKIVDLNVNALLPGDIQWADYVFISAMSVQMESVNKILTECKKYNAKIVAGGPLFSAEYEKYQQIDHLVLNEAEITLPQFLDDLKTGNPKKIYTTSEYPSITNTPVPDYQLLSFGKYASMSIQYTRGCPFACDFCEIRPLFGNKVRIKKTSQVIAELDRLYALNWRGQVFFVVDNFIGNKNVLKNDLLPVLSKWMKEHKYPFKFNTEASINLADDNELMSLMTQSGFNSVFIGVETPEQNALEECNKVQNKNRNLLQNIKKMQQAGLQVTAGFIVGFDSDTPSVFQRQIDFIQQSGIVSAMVGLLNAPKNTRLYKRLESENRLTTEATGNNTDSSMNFTPKMNTKDLLEGYKKIIQNIYGTKPYYKRVRQFILNYKRVSGQQMKLEFFHIGAFLKSIIIIGILNKGRREYWKLLIWTLFKKPGLLIDAVTFTVYGYHFRTIYGLRKSR
jgi:radical SAM superfamily enzyme YgiQ (UPF0313 family)